MKNVRIYTPLNKGIILERREDLPVTNVPHLVTHHSPDGFEWGYGGSGPADLALNILEAVLILEDYTGRLTQCYSGVCFAKSWELHQAFKREFIEKVPHDGVVIPYAKVKAWIDLHLPPHIIRIADSGEVVDADPATEGPDNAARNLGANGHEDGYDTLEEKRLDRND